MSSGWLLASRPYCTEDIHQVKEGSEKEVVVVWNNTVYLQTLCKKTPVARAVAALPVPEPPEGEQL